MHLFIGLQNAAAGFLKSDNIFIQPFLDCLVPADSLLEYPGGYRATVEPHSWKRCYGFRKCAGACFAVRLPVRVTV